MGGTGIGYGLGLWVDRVRGWRETALGLVHNDRRRKQRHNERINHGGKSAFVEVGGECWEKKDSKARGKVPTNTDWTGQGDRDLED